MTEPSHLPASQGNSDHSLPSTPEPTAPLVGRLAPSPTGKLHLGHARSFLLAWWSIRSRNGRLLLRMEDLDPDRVKPGDADQVLRDIEWLGMDWDGEILRQSTRADAYREALAKLEQDGWIYPCVCTRKEIAEAASAPHAVTPTRPTTGVADNPNSESILARGSDPPLEPIQPADIIGDRYPGTCRDRFASLASARELTGRAPAWRMRTDRSPTSGAPPVIVFRDQLLNQLRSELHLDVGDFPLTRKDGIASYQLAVIVDDAAQGITEVLRGDDLLSSTARQALLLDALGFPRPTWIHVPLVLDAAGVRLAKRHDSLSLHELREQGVDPRAIVAWAARSAGMNCPSHTHAADLLPGFDLRHLPRAAVRLTQPELASWIPAAPN